MTEMFGFICEWSAIPIYLNFSGMKTQLGVFQIDQDLTNHPLGGFMNETQLLFQSAKGWIIHETMTFGHF